MAGPGEEWQGADGVTRASEINKAGWSTAGVRSVGAPQARSGMVGLDGPGVVLFSRSRTVLLDARNWGRRMQGSGHTGFPLPSAGCHFPTCPHPALCIFRHVPFLSFDSFSSSNPPDIARHDELPPLAVDHSPPSGGRTRQMVSTWPDARLCPRPHHADTTITGSIRMYSVSKVRKYGVPRQHGGPIPAPTAQSSSLRIHIVVTRFQIKGRAKSRTPDLDNNKKHGTMRGTHRLCNLMH